MNQYQIPLLNVDPLIKIGDAERILSKVLQPVPSRPIMIEWLEEGTLEGRQIGRGQTWHVYKSSLDSFIIDLQPKRQQKLAA